LAAAATVRIEDHSLKPVPLALPTWMAARDGMAGAGISWDPLELRMLASSRCLKCWGEGVQWGRRISGRPYPCGCALRRIFRECLRRYRYCEAHCDKVASVKWRMIARGARRFYSWGLPDQEYCADFCLIGRRTLSGVAYRIFRMHHLGGMEGEDCAWRLGIDLGSIWYQVYMVEQRLGYALRTVRPYALHPVDEYFHGNGAQAEACATVGGMT